MYVQFNSRNGGNPLLARNELKELIQTYKSSRNFEHFRNRFLFATRQTPVLNGITDYNPVAYYEEDDFQEETTWKTAVQLAKTTLALNGLTT